MVRLLGAVANRPAGGHCFPSSAHLRFFRFFLVRLFCFFFADHRDLGHARETRVSGALPPFVRRARLEQTGPWTDTFLEHRSPFFSRQMTVEVAIRARVVGSATDGRPGTHDLVFCRRDCRPGAPITEIKQPVRKTDLLPVGLPGGSGRLPFEFRKRWRRRNTISFLA